MSDTEYRVGDFVFTVELQPGHRPMCRARDKRWSVLAVALGAAELDELAYNASELTGGDREGVTGFVYAEDSDEGIIPPGKVLVYFMKEELYYDRPFFDAAVAEFGLAALDRMARAGRTVSEDTRALFLAVQARARDGI